jgi:hypothetical protein
LSAKIKDPRHLAALWFPAGNLRARMRHPQMGDIYVRNAVADQLTGVQISTRLTVDAFAPVPVWHAEVRLYEPSSIESISAVPGAGVAQGELVPQRMGDLMGADKSQLSALLFTILAGVGDETTDEQEETQYGLHLRRRLTPREVADMGAAVVV